MFTFSGFKRLTFTLGYFSVKTAIISSIFASFLPCVRARADTASINQTLLQNRSHWKRLSSRDRCSDSCYNEPRLCNVVWSRCFGAAQWHFHLHQSRRKRFTIPGAGSGDPLSHVTCFECLYKCNNNYFCFVTGHSHIDISLTWCYTEMMNRFLYFFEHPHTTPDVYLK